MKILAVEDDPLTQMVLEASLRQLGHEVTVATDGAEAWERLRQGGGERVVVSDWMMPGLSGLELCSRLRTGVLDYTYFILLTQQSASDENQETALAAGVDDFLVKPVNARELRLRLRVAERILGYTRRMRQLESFLPICSYCKNVRDDKITGRASRPICTRSRARISATGCVRNATSRRCGRCWRRPGSRRRRLRKCNVG